MMQLQWRWALERALFAALGVLITVIAVAALIDSVTAGRLRRPGPNVELDSAAMIRLPDSESVHRKRAAIASLLWPGRGFPAERMPDAISALDPATIPAIPRGTNATRLVTNMLHGVNSVGYLFEPAGGNRRLAVYHGGHNHGLERALGTVASLLHSGYSVAVLSMPLTGENIRPIIGSQLLAEHDQMASLRTAEFHPISLFLEPVAAAINYAETLGYRDISMLGLSGGGWTTTLYAALDPRVRRSYPVAGSLPLHLRTPDDWSWGDYEQRDADLYNVANYLELYVLGSHGAARRQVQVLNVYDPDCFSGRLFESYEPAVAAAVERLGSSSFRVFADDTHREHMISRAAMLEILADMGVI